LERCPINTHKVNFILYHVIRSAKLLSLRGPAFPAQSLDLSAELATENYARRTMHQSILERDPSAFKKYVLRPAK
jgi:hypothetical protein